MNPYSTDLDRNPANHQPLTPLTFLERAASVFPTIRRLFTEHCAATMQISMLARGSSARL